MFAAGKLNKRITLLASTEVDDGYQTKTEYTPVKTLWANVYYVSDVERYRAGAVNINAMVRFTVRKMTISRDWIVLFDGDRYAITGYKPVLDDDHMMEITAGRMYE